MLNRKRTAEFESLERVAVMSNHLSAAVAGLVPAIHACSTQAAQERRGCPPQRGPRRVTRRVCLRGHDSEKVIRSYRNAL
jgi:hypothetical protein